jgi:ubiquinone biosynthesis protein Coq4
VLNSLRKSIDSERHPKGRARDFYDIYYLVTNFKIDIKNNLGLLRSVFSAKQVELSVLQYVESMYKLHKADEASLQATVSPEIYESFDVYFNYVIGLIKIILSQEI